MSRFRKTVIPVGNAKKWRRASFAVATLDPTASKIFCSSTALALCSNIGSVPDGVSGRTHRELESSQTRMTRTEASETPLIETPRRTSGYRQIALPPKRQRRHFPKNTRPNTPRPSTA